MLKGITDGSEACECHQCIGEYSKTCPIRIGDTTLNLPISTSKMILCGDCGNKRCPKASDHRWECTGSNSPGQEGSIYQQY